ncbi:MAG TPA: cupin domain-containing protein [Bacillota bacterium]|nr:cupin domain-containing protein [Bacillota bacterium]
MDFHLIKEAQQFNLERFTKIDMIKTRTSVAFVLNFLPGQEMKAHHHPNKELYLLVIEGEGTLTIDGEEKIVKKGDVIFCEEEEMIGFINTSEDNVSIYATMSKLP